MNRSLQEKSAARLAAVQLLYKTALTGGKLAPARLMAEYQEYLAEEEKPPVKPNATLLSKLLEGMEAHGEAIEPWVEQCITGAWKKERMSPLLLAILRLGIFELAHFRETKTPVIVNEYATLTGRFFGAAETGFVNAALNAVAVELRG